MPILKSSIVLALLLGAIDAASAQELKAGAAKIDITPPTGFPMWGYASRRDQPSLRVREPLLARAAVIHVGEAKFALVALDLGRPPTRASQDSIARALKEAGIERLFLVASHTHHGPVLETENWPDPKRPYARELERKIIAVILEADRASKSATLGVASKEIDFNHNRVSCHPRAAVDRELTVLRLDDAKDGSAIAQLVNFAAHPTMLPAGLREFSPDFPGFMAREVEAARGGVCLFLQGAAGDLSPDPTHGKTPETFGKKLAGEVLALSGKMKGTGRLSEGLKTSHHRFTFTSRVDLGNPLIRAAYAFAFFPDLVAFYEREYREGIRPEMTIAVLDGRIGIVGVSGEFFAAHALRLKQRAQLDHLLFLGYCNDYHQYFPTIEAAAAGGYGADELVSPVQLGAGERMMDQALIELYRLRDRLR